MAHAEVSEIIPASSERVFDLVHDYGKRLEWDTLLRAAYLDDGFTEAKKGATSVCVGRRSVGGLALKTIYVSFDRPKVAAVKMVNSPPFFAAWAASIRHADIGPGASRITYSFHFTAKPRLLRWFLEPIMGVLFRWETKRRLRALRRHFSVGG
jgi:hypothetical protein